MHDETCYETIRTLACGTDESAGTEGHSHSAACYEEQLVCEIPEHIHTVACISDETADVEAADEWEETIPKNLTGIWADDVIAVAESQLGYTESTGNFVLSEDDNSRRGYTRYGAWYGNPYGDWDAIQGLYTKRNSVIKQYMLDNQDELKNKGVGFADTAGWMEHVQLGMYETVETIIDGEEYSGKLELLYSDNVPLIT